ncbi:MAG: hypothetical protein WB994_19250, partial [Candidatus Acidiferrum sp.]
MKFARNLVSSFQISQPLWISLALFVLLCAVTPGIVSSQNPPAKDDQESAVQTQMRNVTFR